ncbi:hypothetical protein [Nocardia otitidiscaviarum]|uniref:hypothetical protein n=1 Tax=Nocardia otitidiscaviarum TaxID=1823 RepID=UPI001C499A70|nr:hypothetical protein [Nocardia otitidiscaviarum]
MTRTSSSATGSVSVLTPAQIIDADANHWPGWTCRVGTETLWIRFDEIYRASCRQGGPLGSIFDSHPNLPVDSVTCTAASCNCIAGIKATKTAPLPTNRGD